MRMRERECCDLIVRDLERRSVLARGLAQNRIDESRSVARAALRIGERHGGIDRGMFRDAIEMAELKKPEAKNLKNSSIDLRKRTRREPLDFEVEARAPRQRAEDHQRDEAAIVGFEFGQAVAEQYIGIGALARYAPKNVQRRLARRDACRARHAMRPAYCRLRCDVRAPSRPRAFACARALAPRG